MALYTQYLVCLEYRGIHPSDRLWQKQGISYQKRQEMLGKRRKLSRFGLENGIVRYQVELASKTLGIHGICDAVIEHNGAYYPVEFKLSSAKPVKGHRLQLTAYALMLEEHYGQSVELGFILYGDRGKTDTVVFNEWQELTKHAIEQVKHSFTSPLLPHSPASEAQCGQCEYLNYCADRF